MKEPILYQYTDNVIRAPVIDMKTGEQVDPAVFPRVEYSIGEFGGAKLLSLDLSSGISVKNNEFIIYIGSHGDNGADMADLILPGAAYTEQDGYFTNLEGKLQKAYKASYPPGEAKED